MILRSLVVAGILALQASSFLIPLEVKVIQGEEAITTPFETPWTVQETTIELACPGCTYPGPAQEGIEYSEHDENYLVSTVQSMIIRGSGGVAYRPQELHVVVEDSERLKINGQIFYPIGETMSTPILLLAPQIRKSDSTPSRSHILGFAMEILPPATFANEEVEIISLQFTVLDIEGTPVQVDTVRFELIMTEGNLMLAKVYSIPFAQSPGAAECTTSLCRIRAIFAQHIRSALEAFKGHAEKAGAWMSKGCHHGKDRKHFPHGKNKGHGHKSPKHHPHDHHKHHGHFTMHRLGHLLRKMLRFFIVPALLGVIGGLLASAVGMLVGQAIVYLWFRFHRGGNRGPIRLTQAVVSEEEKDSLVQNEELPPQYEDVEVIVVEDSKE